MFIIRFIHCIKVSNLLEVNLNVLIYALPYFFLTRFKYICLLLSVCYFYQFLLYPKMFRIRFIHCIEVNNLLEVNLNVLIYALPYFFTTRFKLIRLLLSVGYCYQFNLCPKKKLGQLKLQSTVGAA
jgi:hypothetical protein